MNIRSFSQEISVFQGRKAPEPGLLAGYGAVLSYYDLKAPLPDVLSLISKKHKQYRNGDWQVFTPRHQPADSLSAHLVFALKYEGIDLLLLKVLFKTINKREIETMVLAEPTGQYTRRIWFLYEWLMDTKLSVPDLLSGNYVAVVDETLQYAFQGKPEVFKRHRIRNNLPGVPEFCPMIRKTSKLESYIHSDLRGKISNMVGNIHPDVMARTAAFLLLKDSKASYAIEGETPPQNRAQRWGRAIGQAGLQPAGKKELIRLQQIVIDNPRFTKMGLREQEGFVGEHDRRTGTPIPDHISARWTDIPLLLDGLIATDEKLEQDEKFDAVLAAAIVAFGFVFIHPFVDGNGRIHRYLFHHVLLRKNYVPKGLIFPVSAIILARLNEYRGVLEHFSHARLEFIEWKPTADNNVEIINDTVDLYRYFDATRHAEFLYSCVEETIEKTIPDEVAYLDRYDQMKSWLDNKFEMPDKTVSLLVRFLEQGRGRLSERARTKEFEALGPAEIDSIENKFSEIFMPLQGD
jgi:Fic/DOC family protein